jgi:hypothetical protein
MSRHHRLHGVDRANALAITKILEELLSAAHPRLRTHIHAIRKALELSDRLDARWLSKNFGEAAT